MKPTTFRSAIVGLFAALALAQTTHAADTPALPTDAPWRVYAVASLPAKGGRNAPPPTFTPAPAAAWASADFDDSGWGRYGADWQATFGEYGFGQDLATRVVYMRNRFGVADPAAAKDLTLTIEFRGGAVVYVNGQEIARAHLPAGELGAPVLAEEYPAEASIDPAGAPLPQSDRPASEHLERYEKRIRKLTAAIPASALRKGANVLAVQLHAAAGARSGKGKSDWSPVGLCDIKLAAGAGLIPYADLLKGTTLWSASPLETVANKPGKRQAGFLWWGVTVTPVGLTRGNPFEPLAPIRAIAPRGGTCSGQVVVSAPAAISGVKATLSPMRHVGGSAALPREALRVAYATQHRDDALCDALMPAAVDGASVQPVWVLADIPRDQTPGWYTGTLAIEQAGKALGSVPVQIFVAAWTLTDPRDNATFVSMYQSPDTLAEKFGVEAFSDRHFALIEKSMTAMSLMGNDVLLVPVTLENYLHHKHGMIRWVKKGSGYEPEFSVLERYLDLQTKVWGKPRVVTLSVWQHAYGSRTWFRGVKSDKIEPCLVTELDPKTGNMQQMQAPHFGEPGSEAFWKAAIEGARRVVKARGIDDRFLLLGEAFDSRPLEKHRAFFDTIAPGMRWQMYSHFDGGEPPIRDGKCITLGGFEIGLRITPGGSSTIPELSPDYPAVSKTEFHKMQVQRTEIQPTSSPLSFRVVMRTSGTIARIGLDFWPMYEVRNRMRSYYESPPSEGWLWRGHVPALTAPGPDGAVRTARGQMLLEGTQEVEAYAVLMRHRAKATGDVLARINGCIERRKQAAAVGKALSQAMISMDLPAMAAAEYALAAELTGARGDGEWTRPPEGAAR